MYVGVAGMRRDIGDGRRERKRPKKNMRGENSQ
jgi:hypothetical protein